MEVSSNEFFRLGSLKLPKTGDLKKWERQFHYRFQFSGTEKKEKRSIGLS